MTAILLFVLEIQTQGLQVQVQVNGITVYEQLNGEVSTFQTKVNQFVVDGDNQVDVSLKLFPEPTDDEGDNSTPEPAFQIKLIQGEHGTEPDDSGLLINYEWSPEETPLNSENFTPVVTKAVGLSYADHHWAWQDAPAGELDKQAAANVLELVATLHSALANKETEKLTELLSRKNAEMAAALGVDAAQMTAGQEAMHNAYFSSDEWLMLPLDSSTLRLIPQADGRLIKIVADDGSAPLRGRAGERPYVLELMVCKIEGSWHVIR